ncbi:hypothetical protein J3E68DRAFT_420376 [Trichoderma sp. SZMC 28012]
MPMARSTGKSLCEIGTNDHFFKLDRHTLLSVKLAACQSTVECPRAGEVEPGRYYVHVAVATHRQFVNEGWRVKRILGDVCEKIQALNLALCDTSQLFTKMDVVASFMLLLRRTVSFAHLG